MTHLIRKAGIKQISGREGETQLTVKEWKIKCYEKNLKMTETIQKRMKNNRKQ